MLTWFVVKTKPLDREIPFKDYWIEADGIEEAMQEYMMLRTGRMVVSLRKQEAYESVPVVRPAVVNAA